jgi:hypothetical protein
VFREVLLTQPTSFEHFQSSLFDHLSYNMSKWHVCVSGAGICERFFLRIGKEKCAFCMLASACPYLSRSTVRLCVLPVDSGSPELQGTHSGIQLQSRGLNECPLFTENDFFRKATWRGKWQTSLPWQQRPSILRFVRRRVRRIAKSGILALSYICLSTRPSVRLSVCLSELLFFLMVHLSPLWTDIHWIW